MKKRQTYSIYQFTCRDLQRSKKKKKVIIFQPKNFPGKQYPRKQTSTKPEKETEKPLRHRYTSSSSSSRSTSGDGKKL